MQCARVKCYTQCYSHPNYTQNTGCILLKDESLICYSYMQSACKVRVFLHRGKELIYIVLVLQCIHKAKHDSQWCFAQLVVKATCIHDIKH